MADVIIEKRCDFKTDYEACGKIVPNNLATEFAVAPDSWAGDLCAEHRKALIDALAPYVAISRRSRAIAAVNGRGRKVLRGKGGKAFTTSDVRAWMQEQGKPVSTGGRVPNAAIEEFIQAHAQR